MGGQPALAIRCRDPSEFITSVVEHHRGEPAPKPEEQKTYLVFIGVEGEEGIMEMIPNADGEYEEIPRQRDSSEEVEEEVRLGVEVDEVLGYREVQEEEDSSEAGEEDGTPSPVVERIRRFPRRIRIQRLQEVEAEFDGYIDGIYDIEERYHRLSTYDREREEKEKESEVGYGGGGDEVDEDEGEEEEAREEPNGSCRHNSIEENLVQILSQSHIQPQEYEEKPTKVNGGFNKESGGTNDGVGERYDTTNKGEERDLGKTVEGEQEIPDSDGEEAGSLTTNNDSPQTSPRLQAIFQGEPRSLVPLVPDGISSPSSPLSSPPSEEEEEVELQEQPLSPTPLLLGKVPSTSSSLGSLSIEEDKEELAAEAVEEHEQQEGEPDGVNYHAEDEHLPVEVTERGYEGQGPIEIMDEEEADKYYTVSRGAPQTLVRRQFVLPIRELGSPIRPHSGEISPLTPPKHSSQPPEPYGEEKEEQEELYEADDQPPGEEDATDEDEPPQYPSNIIETLIAAEHVEILFIPDLETFQVFLETLQYTPTTPSLSPPLLAIWGLVGAHYGTDEFGGEGIGCTLGLAVEAAEGSGRLLVLGEGYVDVEYDDAQDWGGVREMCWMDVEVPILNKGSMIMGRTVVVKNVLRKWCRFGEDLE